MCYSFCQENSFALFPPSDPGSVSSSWRNPSLTLPTKVIILKINLTCLYHSSVLLLHFNVISAYRLMSVLALDIYLMN